MDTITIDFGKDFDTLIEGLFWQDMYFRVGDYLYIENNYTGDWYILERKYNYNSLQYLIDNNIKAEFEYIERCEVEQEVLKEYD